MQHIFLMFSDLKCCIYNSPDIATCISWPGDVFVLESCSGVASSISELDIHIFVFCTINFLGTTPLDSCHKVYLARSDA